MWIFTVCFWVFKKTLAWAAIILLQINQPFQVWNEFATSPIWYSIFKIKEVKLSLICCWVEGTKALRSFLPCFISPVPKDVTSRKAFPGGLMQSFRCGYAHKDNCPEHRNICRELTSSHSSLVKTLPQYVRCANHFSAWRDIYRAITSTARVTIPRPQPWGSLDVHQLSQGHQPTLQTSETCRCVPIPLLCFSMLKTNTFSWDPRERSAMLMRRYHSSASAWLAKANKVLAGTNAEKDGPGVLSIFFFYFFFASQAVCTMGFGFLQLHRRAHDLLKLESLQTKKAVKLFCIWHNH